MAPETKLWYQDQWQIAGVELLSQTKDWKGQVIRRSWSLTIWVMGGLIQPEFKQLGNSDRTQPYACLYKWPNFIPFYGWEIFHCIYVPHLLYPFLCWWIFRLLPCPGIVLQWTVGYMCLEIWFPQNICPGVGLLGQMVVLFLVF